MRNYLIGIFAALALAMGSGCVTNPVTGKKEVRIVGESWELDIGKKQYAPLRQMQGGDYVVDPAVERYVNSVGQRLAAVSDRKLPYEFNVINDGTPNAWALPGGKISINRGLLVELKNEAELAAVLGHEIVHAAAGHGARGMTRGAGLQIGMAAVLIGSQGRIDPNVAQLGAGVGAQLINSKYGRDAERESDLYGIQYMSAAGYDPRGAVSLQETFVRLSEGREQDRFRQMFASHPASRERVSNNRKTAANFPASGELGEERYRRVMSKMMKSKPAYDKYDEAIKAYKKDKDEGTATRLVREAIRLEPREGHFHSFLGDIARMNKRYDAAKTHYDKAISLNNDFFYYYLGRGKLFEARGQHRAARADLDRSMKLLPTSAAQAALGNVAKAQRDFVSAKKHYRAAAAASGPIGQEAMGELMELDLEENPNAYIKTAVGVQNGQVVIQVKNPTPRAVTGLAIQLANTATGKGSTQRMRGVLGPGKTSIVKTGIAVRKGQSVQGLRATVVRAALSRG